VPRGFYRYQAALASNACLVKGIERRGAYAPLRSFETEVCGDNRANLEAEKRRRGAFERLANNAVKFELSGAGRILGLDNGRPFQGTERGAFDG
jgi:hypothetical protein